MAAVQAMVGFVTLIIGRQFYAVYVAAITYMMANLYLPNLLPQQTTSNLLISSVVAGIVTGALCSVLKRPLAIVASFFVAGSLIFGLTEVLGLDPALHTWIAFYIAGAAGALGTLIVFDFAVIFLSAVYGATLVVQSIHIPGFSTLIWLTLLIVFGCIVQWVLLQYGHPEPD